MRPVPPIAQAPRPLWSRPLLWMGIGFVIRLIFLSEQSLNNPLFTVQVQDELELSNSARDILAGKGFGAEPLFKAPLYPLFLAAVMAISGDGWTWAVRFVQHLCGALLIPMGFDAARRITGPLGDRAALRAGAITAAALALYAPLVHLEDRILVDFFSVFLQSAMLWALLRLRPFADWRWALAAGIAAALAVLNRPTVLPVLPFLALAIVGESVRHVGSLRFRHRIVAAGVFLAPVVLTLAGTAWRNDRAAGEALILPWQGGYNFYYANREGANGRYYKQPHRTLDESGNPTRGLAIEGFTRAIADGRAEQPEEGEFFGALNAYWTRQAKDEIMRDPGRWLGLMVRKGIYLWTEREIFNFEDYRTQRSLSWVLRALPVNFGVLFPFALASLAFLPRRGNSRRSLAGMLWIYTLLLGGAIALYYTSGRLRIPLAFPVAVFAGLGLSRAVTIWQGRKTDSPNLTALAAAAVLFATGVLLAWGDWWGVRSESHRDIELERLSTASYHLGQFNRALRHATELAELQPESFSANLLRAQALYGLGRYPEAAEAFTKASRINPSDPVPYYNLGVIAFYEDNSPERALDWFEAALSEEPRYRLAAYTATLAALAQGDKARARQFVAADLPPSAGARRELLVAAMALACAEDRRPEVLALGNRLQTEFGAQALEAAVADLERAKLPGCLKLRPANSP